MFCLCPHESVRTWNLNTFLQKCSSIQDCVSSLCYRFRFTPLHLHCHYLHLCTFISTTFSSLVAICVVYVSTKCCSTTSSSSNSLMNIRSIDVAHGIVCFFAHQLLLLLHKNSTSNVLVIYILWIIIGANCIFSLYTFPSTHSKDNDRCSGNLIADS